MLLPAINDRHVWIVTKNVEIFGVLNMGLIIIEVTINLVHSLFQRELGTASKRSSVLKISLVYLCLVFLILLSICIAYSITFQLSAHLS